MAGVINLARRANLMNSILIPIYTKLTQWDEREELFPLWRPLRFALARLHGYPKLNKLGSLDDKEEYSKILLEQGLENYLPADKSVVVKLSKFYELGMTEANLITLPEKEGLNDLNLLKNEAPFYGYMPYFLYECFEGGQFAEYFANDEELTKWIQKQHLEMLFDGYEVRKENIKDLTGMKDYRKSIPLDLELMLGNYIDVLEKRRESSR